MADTMTKLYALAEAAGYEDRNRETVMGHLLSLAEALWPMGHLDQIGIELSDHFEKGQTRRGEDEWAVEAAAEARQERAAWAKREQDAERAYHQEGYHRDEF